MTVRVSKREGIIEIGGLGEVYGTSSGIVTSIRVEKSKHVLWLHCVSLILMVTICSNAYREDNIV